MNNKLRSQRKRIYKNKEIKINDQNQQPNPYSPYINVGVTEHAIFVIYPSTIILDKRSDQGYYKCNILHLYTYFPTVFNPFMFLLQ